MTFARDLLYLILANMLFNIKLVRFTQLKK